MRLNYKIVGIYKDETQGGTFASLLFLTHMGVPRKDPPGKKLYALLVYNRDSLFVHSKIVEHKGQILEHVMKNWVKRCTKYFL